MKTLGKRLAIVVASALVAACAGMEIETDYDAGYDFRHLKTFTWMPETAKKRGDPRVYNDIVDNRIKKALQPQLEEKGFAKVAEEAEADFLVGYHTLLQEKLSAKTINDFYGYQGVWSRGYYLNPGVPQTYIYEYEQGTLLLDIVDAKTRRMVWRGSAKTELDRNPTPEKRDKLLNEAISQILKEFPPAPKK